MPSTLQMITAAPTDMEGGVKAEGWRGCAWPEISMSLGEEEQMSSAVTSSVSQSCDSLVL